MEERPRFTAPALHALVTSVLERLEVPEQDARAAADALIASDLMGIDSHGVARFSGHPSYVPGLARGVVNPRPFPVVVTEQPSTALLDGDRGMGVVIATRAMRMAIEKARGSGVGMIAVTNSRHFGIAGHFARMAVSEGMIGIAMTNAFPQVALPGGVGPVLGTNPIALAAPRDGGPPFCVDIASSVGAAGKAEIARRAGKRMPPGWVVDADGNPTDAPEAVLGGGGALLPLGSTVESGAHKGYGLAAMVDVLCGVLSGVGHGAVLDPLSWECGHFLAAIRIEAFRPLSAFTSAMASMASTIVHAPRQAGVPPFRIHGEPEHEAEQDRRAHGIPLHPEVVADLRSVSARYGVPFPAAVA
ncbi:MAG: Ldh family oxidoreductase [Chloroflexi bacterium]|nr:Ldh family oxidoreductase [Chloroflexota bacterium]